MPNAVAAALSPLRIPFQAMVVALAGAGTAWLFLKGHWEPAVLGALAVVAIGVACDQVGKAVLPKHPVLAVYLFEGWLLIPLAVAVLASAALIIVAIKAALPEKNAAGEPTSTETEELVGAVSAGITAFLTAGFVSWAGDEKDSRLADHVKGRFEDKFTRPGVAKPGARVFAAGSDGEQWVYSGEFEGIEGWGWAARQKRAREIAAELESGASDPRPA